MMEEAEQRAAVVAEAKSWLRTPHRNGQRLKGAGVDCAMFPAEVYHSVGLVPHIEVEHYPRDWHHHNAAERYLAKVFEYATEIAQVEARPGDLVLFVDGKCYAHGAIIQPPGWPRVIHADSNIGYVTYAKGDGGKLGDERTKPRFFTLWPKVTP